jgi:hypothetical protein
MCIVKFCYHDLVAGFFRLSFEMMNFVAHFWETCFLAYRSGYEIDLLRFAEEFRPCLI